MSRKVSGASLQSSPHLSAAEDLGDRFFCCSAVVGHPPSPQPPQPTCWWRMFSLGPRLCLCLCINPRVLPPEHPQPQGSPQHVRPSASSFLGGGAGMFCLSFTLPNTPIFLSATRQHGQGRRLRVRYLPRELLSTRRAAERGAGGQHGSLKCCLSLRALSLRGRGPCGRAGGSKAPWMGRTLL